MLPAIDLVGGRVVRLHQGRYDQVTTYPFAPVDLARRYAAAGAGWLHVVDLDAARTGERSEEHGRLLQGLMDVPGLRLQLGGGIRSAAQISSALELGAARVMVGTLAAAEPDLVGGSPRKRAAWWSRSTAATGACAPTAGSRTRVPMRRRSSPGSSNAGARDFLVTGIDRDGTGRGPDLELIAGVRALVPGLLLSAGGVGSAADVAAAVAAGADAVVIGRGLVDGTIPFA